MFLDSALIFRRNLDVFRSNLDVFRCFIKHGIPVKLIYGNNYNVCFINQDMTWPILLCSCQQKQGQDHWWQGFSMAPAGDDAIYLAKKTASWWREAATNLRTACQNYNISMIYLRYIFKICAHMFILGIEYVRLLPF